LSVSLFLLFLSLRSTYFFPFLLFLLSCVLSLNFYLCTFLILFSITYCLYLTFHHFLSTYDFLYLTFYFFLSISYFLSLSYFLNFFHSYPPSLIYSISLTLTHSHTHTLSLKSHYVDMSLFAAQKRTPQGKRDLCSSLPFKNNIQSHFKLTCQA
jgi:hypothetical protein